MFIRKGGEKDNNENSQVSRLEKRSKGKKIHIEKWNYEKVKINTSKSTLYISMEN